MKASELAQAAASAAPYRRILVPFDDSPLARAALAVGTWMAWKGGSELNLVQAYCEPSVALAPSGTGGQGHSIRLAEANKLLSAEALTLNEYGVNAIGFVESGETIDVLLRSAERLQVDLAVMGTHARSLPQRWLLGSVAAEFARRAPVPVLLVPRQVAFRRDDALRILVALDGSVLAEAGLDVALRLTRTVPASLTLFQVLPGDAPAPNVSLQWYEQPILGLEPYLERLQARLHRQGINAGCAYSTGSAGAQILTYAERGAFDVIAVGSHSRTGLPRLALGSVTEQILRQAQTPVLVAHSQAVRVIPPRHEISTATREAAPWP